jgi:outer membrane receptor for ferrienterochelin and colicin
MSAQQLAKKKVAGSFKNKSLDLALFDLKINYRLVFDYDEADTKGLTVNVYLSKMPLSEAMPLLLYDTGLDFSFEEPNRVTIFKPSAATVSNPATLHSKASPERTDFNLSGTIKDAISGESLPFTTVAVKGTTLATTSNVDGYFTLLKVPTDTVLLEVSYLGYQTTFFRMQPDLATSGLEIRMNPASQLLQQVNVTASREDQMMKASTGISQLAVNPAQLTAIPSLGERDVFRSLQLLPGVSGSNESSSGLYVRGGTPDQNLVLFDGFTVYQVDHLFGFFSAFNSDAIKDVQLFKGGFESKYGGRLSSVVDITGKDGNTEEFNAGIGLSLLSANAFVESPFANGKGSIILTGRRSFQSSLYDNLLNLSDGGETGTEEDDGTEDDIPTAGFRRGIAEVQPTSWFYDLNGKVTYRTAKDVFSLSTYSGKDKLDNSADNDAAGFGFGGRGGGGGRPGAGGDEASNFERSVVDLSDWGNTGASLKWSRRWNDKLYSNALISRSNYFSFRDRTTTVNIETDTSSLSLRTGTVEENDLVDLSAKWDWEWQAGKGHKIGFGAFASAMDIKYDYFQNDTTSILARDDQGLISGFYLQDRITIQDKLIIVPGLRVSHFDQTQQVYTEPRLQMQYLPNERLKIKAATGRYYQFANRIIREDISQGSRDFWILADDERVPVGRSDQFILGASYETKDWLFDVEGYYKILDNLSEYSTRFSSTGLGRNASLDFTESFLTGSGTSKGIEFLLQKKAGPLTGWLSYTLGRVEYDFEAYGEDAFPASHDVTHEAKIVALYQPEKSKLSFGATLIYATGKPYTAPLGAYTVELLDGGTQDLFAVSTKNSLRLPDYHRLDLSVNYDMGRFMGGRAKSSFSLFNAYNRKNVWYKEFDVVEGQILETNVNLLGLTPSLGFTWSIR